MGICDNVYRRGAVYWWRCRFGPAEGGTAGRVVAISLRTRDPCSARSLDARLNAEAELARRARVSTVARRRLPTTISP